VLREMYRECGLEHEKALSKRLEKCNREGDFSTKSEAQWVSIISNNELSIICT
jgi:hypothetical protein